MGNINYLKNLSRQICHILLSIIFAILAISLLVFLIFPLFLYRSFVILIAKHFKSESLDKILNLRSQVFAYLGPIYINPRWNCFSQMILEGKPDIHEIRKKVQEVNNLRDKNTGKLLYPEMNQNISCYFGYPFWNKLKKDADLSKLVHYYMDDENLKSNDDLVINSLKNEFFNKTYPEDEPLWEMIVYPNYTINPLKPLIQSTKKNQEYYVLVFKFSHILADGISSFTYLQRFSKDFQFVQEKPTKSTLPSIWELTTFFYELPELVLYLISRYMSSKKLNVTQDINKENPAVLSVTKSFSFKKLGQIKAKHPSVNGITVVITAIAEALILHVKNLPTNIKVMIPLSRPEYDGTLTNHATISFFSIPLENMDCISRMYEIQKSLEIMRKSSFQMVIFNVQLLAGFLPRCLGYFLYRVSCIDTPTQVDLISVSNLAVPKQLDSFNGHKIVSFLASCGAIVGSNALHILPVSCNGNMIVSVVGNVNILESQWNANLLTIKICDQIEKIIGNCQEKFL